MKFKLLEPITAYVLIILGAGTGIILEYFTETSFFVFLLAGTLWLSSLLIKDYFKLRDQRRKEWLKVKRWRKISFILILFGIGISVGTLIFKTHIEWRLLSLLLFFWPLDRLEGTRKKEPHGKSI